MNYSKRQLYAAGECLGECVTQTKAGGGYVCGGGGGGSSSSSAQTTTTTVSTDKRVVADNGAQVNSVDVGGSANFQLIDAGAVQAGRDVSIAALASNSTNVDHLLTTAEKLWSTQQAALQSSQDLTKTLAAGANAAYADAANQSSGNKQLILAAIATVGVVAFTSFKR